MFLTATANATIATTVTTTTITIITTIILLRVEINSIPSQVVFHFQQTLKKLKNHMNR